MLKVLMVTTETVPFAKTGGLADMVSALSAALKEDFIDVRIIMPRYYAIDKSKLEKFPTPLYVQMPYGDEWAALLKGELPDSSVPVYFIDHEGLYGRDGIYGYTPDKGFEDNSKRYAFFCKAVFKACKMADWIPDILHCHDWGSAIVPFLMHSEEHFKEFSGSFSVLTIHNLGYQGIFPLADTCFIKNNLSEWERSAIEFGGALNFLKTGIMSADIITTVSPNYAKEIQTSEYGERLDFLLRARSNDVYGILNGADYSHWNPETDSFIAPNNYSAEKITNKSKAKKMLQKEFKLPQKNAVPIISMVTRLVSQKGIVELCVPGSGSLYSICNNFNLQFVIIGSGDKWCEEELSHLAEKVDNLKVWIGYNDRLAHLVEAGSDFFLMPSKYEPCGLNQLYSQRYGTLPIVRNTGGLADTVENYNQEKGTGTGFIFNDLTPQAIYNTVGWAISTWYDRKKDILKMRRKAMKKDFSWKISTEKYKELYIKLVKRRYPFNIKIE